eukprot:2633-Heterococcus_DN1.PRE.1
MTPQISAPAYTGAALTDSLKTQPPAAVAATKAGSCTFRGSTSSAAVTSSTANRAQPAMRDPSAATRPQSTAANAAAPTAAPVRLASSATVQGDAPMS